MKKNKIRLGVIFDQHIGVGGGYPQAINAALLANKLSNEDTEVVFFTTYKKNIMLFSNLGIKANFLNIGFFNKIFSALKRSLNHPRFLKIFNTILKYSKFEKIILNHNIDLVYFLSPSNFAQDLDETNFIITVWDLNYRYNNEFPEIRNNNFIEYLENFYSKTLRKASSVVVDSEMSKRDINKYYSIDKERIFVIPFEPSIAVTKNDTKKENFDVKKKYNLDIPYIFYPAQFWAHKNHVYILKGLKILEKNYNKTIGAIFSGSNQGNLEHVQNETSRLGLNDRIRFIGFVEDKEISQLYLNSIALVMPTFFGPTNLPPLEAFSLGVPVLYSDLPGLKDQVKDAALLIDLKDPLSMANHLNNLIENEELRNKLIKLGHERLNHFNQIDRYKILNSAINEFRFKRSSWNNS